MASPYLSWAACLDVLLCSLTTGSVPSNFHFCPNFTPQVDQFLCVQIPRRGSPATADLFESLIGYTEVPYPVL